MQIEYAYKTASPVFEIFENFEKYFLFSKIFQDQFLIKKRYMCIRTLADEYVYKVPSCFLEKQLSFAVLNAQKATFSLFTRISAFLLFSFFVPFWPIKVF